MQVRRAAARQQQAPVPVLYSLNNSRRALSVSFIRCFCYMVCKTCGEKELLLEEQNKPIYRQPTHPLGVPCSCHPSAASVHLSRHLLRMSLLRCFFQTL